MGGPIIAIDDLVLGGGTCLKPPYIVEKFLACCFAGMVGFFPLAFIFFDCTFDKTRRGRIEGRRAQKVQVFGQVRRDKETKVSRRTGPVPAAATARRSGVRLEGPPPRNPKEDLSTRARSTKITRNNKTGTSSRTERISRTSSGTRNL